MAARILILPTALDNYRLAIRETARLLEIEQLTDQEYASLMGHPRPKS